MNTPAYPVCMLACVRFRVIGNGSACCANKSQRHLHSGDSGGCNLASAFLDDTLLAHSQVIKT